MVMGQTVTDYEPEPKLGKPTTAQPGTAAKLAVMKARYDAGQAIFHPGDPVHEHAYNQPKRDTVSLQDLRAALQDKNREYQDNE